MYPGIRRDADPLLLKGCQAKVAVSGSWKNVTRGSKENVKLLDAKNVSRLIGSSTSAFQPCLTENPHSMKPLSVLVEYDEQGKEMFSHPYIYEMERDQPVSAQLSLTVPVKATDIPSTPLMYVDTVEKLQEMIKELQTESIIGEHHSYRSYLGN